MDFKVVKASTPDDRSSIEKFLHDHFIIDRPIVQAFGLNETPTSCFPSPLGPAQSPGDFSLMAIDAKGNIVAVAVNKVSISYDIEPDTPLQIQKMLEFSEWAEQDARLETLPEQTIELRVLAVHREWRGRGVARLLAEESMRQARESGFQAMRGCCTSEYTARMARGLGWREHYRLRYADYPSRARVDVTMTPEPPHLYMYYYVIDI